MIVTTENQDMLLEAAARETASTGWAKDATAVGFADERGLIGSRSIRTSPNTMPTSTLPPCRGAG